MPDKNIKELLRKYLNGSATPEEQKLVDDWYESLSDDREMRLSDAERSDLRMAYWRSLEANMGVRRKHRQLWPMLALAAAVSGILAIVLFFTPSFHSRDDASSVASTNINYETIKNETGEAKHITLSDSSVIRLSPGSALSISPMFNINDREIHLSGQAFFDIHRNESKPFYVVANEVVTRVLGTSFTVTAYPNDKDITVAVESGKVSVYTHTSDVLTPRGEKIVLRPNQQAVYNRNAKKVSKTLVKKPRIVIPKEEAERIRFEHVPVSEIFKALEKMYGVDIDFDEDAFSNCSMTTSATGNDLYERIDVICEITGASYTIEDARIHVTGSGCN